MPKQNCWEFKKCGREGGGAKAEELGTCPANTTRELDGTHDGKNAGRTCWVVSGTMCGGKVQGTFAKKYDNCEKCDFYRTVKQEEGHKYIFAPLLLNKLRNAP